SYEHGFTKKHVGHKLCAKLRTKSSFDLFSQKFKILAIPNVLALGKSYEDDFTKKYDGHKFCVKSHAKSSFNRFVVNHLRISKYWPFPMY
ncbi:hypothetical protein BHE74_00039698, partial [Ensete ventricosum]